MFKTWFAGLRDLQAKARINARIRRLSEGNAGDAEPVGQGISEMRIHHGPGYRVYFLSRSTLVVVLLCGGDKSSQKRDIAAAKAIAKDWRA